MNNRNKARKGGVGIAYIYIYIALRKDLHLFDFSPVSLDQRHEWKKKGDRWRRGQGEDTEKVSSQ